MAARYGGGNVTKAIPGISALAMILLSPVCYTLNEPFISVALVIAGWTVLIVLASRIEEE